MTRFGPALLPWLAALVGTISFTASASLPAPAPSPAPDAAEGPSLAFEENRGQLAEDFLFSARGDGFRLHLGRTGEARLRGRHQESRAPFELTLRWDGGQTVGGAAGEALLPGVLHYYTSPSSRDWVTGVRRFARVRYAEVYPGIDLVYRDNATRIEYDFVVAAGADPSRIAMAVEGADGVRIEAGGALAIRIGPDVLRLAAPVLYQQGATGREIVAGRYAERADGSIGFEVGVYDRSRELVVDPVLLGYSTRLGGSGADEASEIRRGSDGSIFLVGSTTSSDFLQGSAAAQGTDAFVARVSSDGRQLVYAAILGSPQFDLAWDVTSDVQGNAYVAGHTEGAFPTTANAYQQTYGGGNADAFLARLDPTGALFYSSFYGAAGDDGQFDGGIALRSGTRTVYFAGRTESSTLPLVNPHDSACTMTCAFVAAIDTNLSGSASLVYSGYLGGDGEEAALALGIDASARLYVFGFTSSDNDLVDATQAWIEDTQDALNRDHFLVVLDPALVGAAQRVYSTYIGGDDDEPEGGDIVTDFANRVWIVGETSSTSPVFPVSGGVQLQNGGGSDGYVVALDVDQVGAASHLWSSFVGGSGADLGSGVAVDAALRVYVALSSSNSADLPLVDPLPQFDPPAPGASSPMVLQYSSDGQTLLLSTPVPAAQRLAMTQGDDLLVYGGINGLVPLRKGLPVAPTGGLDLYLGRLDPFSATGLTLTATDTMQPVEQGDTFAYRYLVTNTSSETLTNLSLSSTLPVGLVEAGLSAECAPAGGMIDCDLFDLGPGENTPVYLRFSTPSNGTFSIAGSVAADQADPKPSDNSADEETTVETVGLQVPAITLRKSDFDVVANGFDIGEFSLDAFNGVVATANGSLDGSVNFMVFDGAIDLAIVELLGQGELAFGFVERNTWTPSDGDGGNLIGRQGDGPADRVFAVVDQNGFVELRTAGPLDAGRVVSQGAVDLTRFGVWELVIDKIGSNAQVLYDGDVVAEGDPFTADPADADPNEVGDDQVITVSHGTEFRGAALITVPEPDAMVLWLAGLGGLLLAACRRGLAA